MLLNLRKLIQKINNFFISMVLIAVYFFAVGLSFIVYKLLMKTHSDNETYWENIVEKNNSVKHFRLPY